MPKVACYEPHQRYHIDPMYVWTNYIIIVIQNKGVKKRGHPAHENQGYLAMGHNARVGTEIQ